MGRRKAGHGSDHRHTQEEVEVQEEETHHVGSRRRRKIEGEREAEQGQGAEEQERDQRRRLTPLAEAHQLLRDVHAVTDKVMVGLSGGKDSLATLDLCVSEFGATNVSCFYMYLVKGLDCVEQTLRWCERRYKIEVHFFPHWQLGLAYKYAAFMPHRTGASEWRDMRLIDVEAAARAETGATWIANGHRMTDSIERVGMLTKNKGIDRVGHRVYPLRRWNEASVVAYLRAKKIPPPPRLTILKRSMSGVSFQEDVLLAIKQRYPDDYARILEVFPYLHAKLVRLEFQKTSWKQKTYLDKWRTSLKGR
jgi:3'-phosphoadenosine 5'-phosphosulfate sulfotransferase (PAPS reductase)/FAD synthetase